MNEKTHGLVSPETFEIPSVSPLWTPMAYAAFDDSKIGKEVSYVNTKSFRFMYLFMLTLHT